MENVHCKATPVSQRVAFLVTLHIKAKEKDFFGNT